MRALSAAELLDAWEAGLARLPQQRLLGLLAACSPEPPDEIAHLSVGRRDARLLALRGSMFGRDLPAIVSCGVCGERMQLSCDVAALLSTAAPDRPDSWLFSAPGYEIRCRLPDSVDLMAIAGLGDPASARAVLLERCLSDARRDGVPIAIVDVPAEVIGDAMDQMAQADPHANLRIAVECTGCGRASAEDLDVGTFLWSEIHAWALRTLREVHVLASSYGWFEQDILAMSAWRRHFYVQSIGR